MSYPRVIQPLIIEDEVDAKEYYEAVLADPIAKGEVAPPRFAFSYEEGQRLLNENVIYHLVILDLRLPESPGLPPMASVDLGLKLLEQCAHRDAYPIPVLLVISGHLDQTNQRYLDTQVRNRFAYGRVLVKSNNLEDELLTAVRDAERYCSVGIHVRDGGELRYPTLSPRDEDLLRRCVLQNEERVGVDLEWWAAEYMRPTGEFKECKGWTKTLMGRFVLSRGIGLSRPTFFKLSPDGGAEQLSREAQILGHKLSHIKVQSALVAGDRSVLVTEKVGESNEPPISLETFLGRPAEQIQETLAAIVADVVTQVRSLGEVTPDQGRVSRLVWKGHDRARILNEWKKYASANKSLGVDPDFDPTTALDTLAASDSPVQHHVQTCLHGDLNITNIAIDELPSGPRAYIFDASGCVAGVNVRDLAMLEVTALLHQSCDGEDSLVQHCSAFYRDSVEPPAEIDFSAGTNRARNTTRLLVEIRKQALAQTTPTVYALMVYDQALLQLGGLEWLSGNKICSPSDAVHLVWLAAKWLPRVAPHLFGAIRPDVDRVQTDKE
jgi:CheY-like chemotaxis protein